jgi:L-2-hydroxyglutarate oxidase LhgO
VQIIKKDAEKGGVLKLGTEVVVDQQKTISALLGASPGASTAAPITLNVLKQMFPSSLTRGVAEPYSRYRPELRPEAERQRRADPAGLG